MCPPNDNSLPQIHTLFVPPIWVIPALPPSFRQAPSTPARHFPFPHEPGRLPCGVHIRFHDSGRSLYCGFGEHFPTFFRSESVRTMPGFRRDRSFKSRIAPGPCLPPLSHTLVFRSKIILTSLFHVFAPHLVDMGNHPPRPRILTARPLFTPPFFSRRRSPPFTHHTLRHCQRRPHVQERLSWVSGYQKDRLYYQDYRPQPDASPRTCFDAQKYFYAVTYDHQLRDSPSDVY